MDGGGFWDTVNNLNPMYQATSTFKMVLIGVFLIVVILIIWGMTKSGFTPNLYSGKYGVPSKK